MSVYAGSALEQVKSSFDQITAVLDDESFRQSHTKEELNKKLREIAHKEFDWEEIARRSLGLYWKERSQEEKKEFTTLFTNLLEDTYTTKIVNNYSGERVLYDKETIDGDRALVESRIINKAEKEVSVSHRLVKRGNKWVAYDVIIEGVSMVKNYRVQFYSIIRKSSYNEIIKKLREKQLK
jgi:phospholipid transport system substrate-binding protein